jgi:hypothetical protein
MSLYLELASKNLHLEQKSKKNHYLYSKTKYKPNWKYLYADM